MANTEVLDREKLINTIWQNKGKVALVAERMGVTTVTIYNYAKKYATVQTAIQDAQAHADTLIVDIAETKTQQLVMGGDWSAIKYTLSTKGKDRGWVERQERKFSGQVDVRNLSDDELIALIED